MRMVSSTSPRRKARPRLRARTCQRLRARTLMLPVRTSSASSERAAAVASSPTCSRSDARVAVRRMPTAISVGESAMPTVHRRWRSPRFSQAAGGGSCRWGPGRVNSVRFGFGAACKVWRAWGGARPRAKRRRAPRASERWRTHGRARRASASCRARWRRPGAVRAPQKRAALCACDGCSLAHPRRGGSSRGDGAKDRGKAGNGGGREARGAGGRAGREGRGGVGHWTERAGPEMGEEGSGGAHVKSSAKSIAANHARSSSAISCWKCLPRSTQTRKQCEKHVNQASQPA